MNSEWKRCSRAAAKLVTDQFPELYEVEYDDERGEMRFYFQLGSVRGGYAITWRSLILAIAWEELVVRKVGLGIVRLRNERAEMVLQEDGKLK